MLLFCFLTLEGGICAIKPLSLCRGYFEVFYFNIERKECEKIVVGGCHESGWNGFETIEECQDTCQGMYEVLPSV